MFKHFVVGIVTALFLAIVLFTPPVSAASRYWQVMETPGLNHGLHIGEITLNTYNTAPSFSNSLQLTPEQELADHLRVTTEMSTSLRKCGYHGLRAGLRYSL